MKKIRNSEREREMRAYREWGWLHTIGEGESFERMVFEGEKERKDGKKASA